MIHHVREGWHLFWDQETLAWTLTDGTGASALESLRRPRTLDEVAFELATQTGFSVSDVRPEVAQLMESAVRCGVVEVGCGPGRTPEPIAGNRVPHPAFLYLHLTSRCNLRCSYCYASPGPSTERNGHDLPVPVAREVLSQARDLGVEEVVVTGGEPLLHPQAVDIVEEAKGMGFQVNLLTNGLGIERGLARRLASACDQITISLDSADPAIHDRHRGGGSHGRASRAIAALSEVGCPHVVAAGVLTRHNQHERYENFAAHATGLGAERVFRAVYILQGDSRDAALRPDFTSLVVRMGEESDAALHGAQPRGERPRLAWRDRCGAAFGVVAVGADGVVYPCQGLMRPEFAAGSLREEPLERIYTQAPVLTKLRAITVADIPACSHCAYRFLCGGGCRALAYNVTRDITAPIPEEYCVLAQLLAQWRLWETALSELPVTAGLEVIP